ncbi:MAG: hypothetical protein ABR589_01930 [Chthoniobacterales bacterium]
MTSPDEPGIDWSVTTWKGSRRKQHEEYRAIPFSRKLEIIEEMNRFALATLQERRARGLPYIDPYTGDRVSGASVREEPRLTPPSRDTS